MKDFYINSLNKKRQKNERLFEETLIELVGSNLEWSKVEELDIDVLRKMTVEVERKIRLEDSPIDVKKMAYAIQHSRSGIGGCAMTQFTCSFCGKEEWWGSTAVPNICTDCATKMATNIAMHHSDLLKEGEDK